MEVGERIKLVRKEKGLSLEEFGSKICMGKSAVSRIENGINGTTDQTIRSICREFGVNERWLRTGEGEMFEQRQEAALAHLAEEYALSQDDVDFLNAYLQLPPEHRASFGVYSSILARIKKDRT